MTFRPAFHAAEEACLAIPVTTQLAGSEAPPCQRQSVSCAAGEGHARDVFLDRSLVIWIICCIVEAVRELIVGPHDISPTKKWVNLFRIKNIYNDEN
jgi:hypothetical protein